MQRYNVGIHKTIINIGDLLQLITNDKFKSVEHRVVANHVVNHGIPLSVLEELKDGVKSSPALNWRDTFVSNLAPDTPNPEDFPVVCRDILIEYGKYMMNLGTLLFELLSEALDKWIDITPVPGALIVNVGDLLQLITNDKFKSVEHRVLANKVGPRISVASFFSTAYNE
ncbi:hypothetical protein P8452_68332 [Trifolium repens]|nr:hypothetical protein P8452_68332 [Trifolium repens]